MKKELFVILRNYMLLVAIALVFLLTGCGSFGQFGGINLFGVPPSGQNPNSAFVDARAVLPVKVGRPVEIGSYHLDRDDRLGEVQVWVNNQLVRSEQTAAPSNFPDYLGDVQVLGWIDQRDASKFLIFPSATCDYAEKVGAPRTVNPIKLDFPSSSWSLCHTWIGLVPGTYELKLQATDRGGNKGQPIVQPIEVLE